MKRDGLPAVGGSNKVEKPHPQYPPEEVLDLARRAQSGDVSSHRRLFDLARPLLWHTARRYCADPELLDEMESELYLLFCRRLQQFDPERHVYFFTFLQHGLVKQIRYALGRVRKQMRPCGAPGPPREEAVDACDGGRPAPRGPCRPAPLPAWAEPADAGQIDDAMLERLVIRQALTSFSSPVRAVIDRRMERWGYDKIAAELRMTPEACRQAFHRARTRLREILTMETPETVTNREKECLDATRAAQNGKQTAVAAPRCEEAPAGLRCEPDGTTAPPPEPRITAVILARNEERTIEDALRSVQPWVDEILVIDNESEDGTVAIARRYTDRIVTARRADFANCFDAARNLAIEHATGDWIFVLDADERVPPRLGQELRRLVREEGDTFAALAIPFKHYFCGKWMEHSGWWPGYTRPQLLKKGRFRYNERLHSGVEVDGPRRFFPCDDPELAIDHYSYESLRHYLQKLNRYTDGEAESLLADGGAHTWQAQLAHFVHDWQQYYEHGRADLDGMHGFVLAFMSAFYRFAARAKLWDLRRQRGELTGNEPVPADLREMLDFMAHVAQHGAAPWLQDNQPSPPPRFGEGVGGRGQSPVPLLWHAPLLDASGFADEARHFVLGLVEAGEPLALAPCRWGDDESGATPELRAAIEARAVPPDAPAELFVSHTLLVLQRPSPLARFNVARTMFETDGLPPGGAEALNAMDRVWVPSAFNRETFARSGVDSEKIAVLPGAIDAHAFAAEAEPWPLPGEEAFRFLSVFDWTRHKGWDVLLEAFAREFGSEPGVGLVLKVWSSNGYTLEQIHEQADAFLRHRLGRSLASFPNIHLWHEMIPSPEMPRLYRAADAFVLPTRGEGWGRPLMEAMAAGLPTIATAWSGLTAFHDARVGYPLKCDVVPVSAEGAREIPVYAGHRWAEPDQDDLRRLMRGLVEKPDAARQKGRAAQQIIGALYSREAVTALIQEELARCRDLARCRPETRRAAVPSLSPSRRNGEGQAAGDHRDPVSGDCPPPRFGEGGRGERSMLPKANPVPINPVAPVDFRAALGRPLRVRWEGDQSLLSSLARVNRAFCLGLLAAGDVELTVAEAQTPWHTLTERDDPRMEPLLARRGAALSGPPDVTIRHHFPPNWRRPEAGRLVVMQPWEYGHLPREWVAGARDQADEVWVYSRFARDVYVRSGVPAEKVRVVPLGFDPEIFEALGPRLTLPTGKSHRFLFVGGALHRKGADLLLEAYLRAFTAADDVCLVVKDMGTRTFYQGQTFAEAFRQAQAVPRAPEIFYLDEDLADPQLAALYRACSWVVLPYRGEGFALSPLEGMACGLPAIVTSGGPTDDYLDDTMTIRLPHRRLPANARTVGPFDCVGDPWQLEPDLDALIEALRWARDHPEERRRLGEAARTHAHVGWTWECAVAGARERLRGLVAPRHDAPLVPATPWSAREERTADGRERSAVELSLCMIVRDEEPRLAACLDSVAPHVDEMVVVDTGSTDRTREIARERGARVFDFPWTESFADARNQSLTQARGDWIFWVDADDLLSPESGRKLRDLIRRHPARDVAYQVQVRIPPSPGEFNESVVDHVKLFPNRPDLRFEHRIHEQILPSIRRAGLEVRFSDLFVTHANYDRSDEGQAKKRRRDFRLLELDLRDRPDHPFVLFNLGMTHLYATKEYEVAAHYLRRSLDRSHCSDSIVRKAFAMLTWARMCQGEWAAALAANEEGRSYYPDDAELLFQAGQLYQQVGRFDEARRALERLISEEEEPHYRSVDTGLRTYRGRHELALLFRRMGDGAHCEQMLREIAADRPSYLPAQEDHLETLAMLEEELVRVM
jgi:RNA polymerase sigma factor (sigma-70 family)